MSSQTITSKQLVGDVWEVWIAGLDGKEHMVKVDGCKISREEKSLVFKSPEEVERDALDQFMLSRPL